MLSKVYSATTMGLDGILIEVEVDVTNRGFPTFTIVGLPDKAVDEAKERVRAAIINAGFKMPDSRITVNLAPADIPKIGSGFDLPIAIGILAAAGLIKQDKLNKSLFLGELSLDGKIREVPGVLSVVLAAKKKNIDSIFLSLKNAFEASIVEGLTIYPILKLLDLILYLNGNINLSAQPHFNFNDVKVKEIFDFDFADIKGQVAAKRGLEIAAAGFHNLHLTGPPGAGKTMLSRAFPSILSPLEKEEILEVSKIYSVCGLLNNLSIINKRPFRSPHHTTSRIGLIGGGSTPTPGEISLAHRGVLFLDEFPEFPRSTLESLRQPLEDGMVVISRASGSLTFPCQFILLAASNPCPCGYLGHPKKACRCSPSLVLKYKKRLSGPLLDRIDMHIEVPPVEEDKLVSDILSESSLKIKERVMKAYERQKKRFKDTKIKNNGRMTPADIKKFCHLNSHAHDLLKQAISRFNLSARSYFKIIKISQTIADLQEKEKIEAVHIAEALQFRLKEEV